ncbi:hypothetical protein MSAN_01745000 [Mycena sanguinolenta]|uniref:Uncharacterized protein n=1 Tax=Mycena sanguinolenta TaxID=230812 RepID=A0A8H6XZR2_9AGAR|nr:hypothetical protein MSAN_01745000 [Mycena sanguinolenta]
MDQWTIAVLGAGSVGKTKLGITFLLNSFLGVSLPSLSLPPINAWTDILDEEPDPQFFRKQFVVDNRMCYIEVLTPTASQVTEPSKDEFLAKTQGFVLVYSITSRSSFDHIEEFHRAVVQVKGANAVCILVGNKCDKQYEREVISFFLIFDPPCGTHSVDDAPTAESVNRGLEHTKFLSVVPISQRWSEGTGASPALRGLGLGDAPRPRIRRAPARTPLSPSSKRLRNMSTCDSISHSRCTDTCPILRTRLRFASSRPRSIAGFPASPLRIRIHTQLQFEFELLAVCLKDIVSTSRHPSQRRLLETVEAHSDEPLVATDACDVASPAVAPRLPSSSIDGLHSGYEYHFGRAVLRKGIWRLFPSASASNPPSIFAAVILCVATDNVTIEFLRNANTSLPPRSPTASPPASWWTGSTRHQRGDTGADLPRALDRTAELGLRRTTYLKSSAVISDTIPTVVRIYGPTFDDPTRLARHRSPPHLLLSPTVRVPLSSPALPSSSISH